MSHEIHEKVKSLCEEREKLLVDLHDEIRETLVIMGGQIKIQIDSMDMGENPRIPFKPNALCDLQVQIAKATQLQILNLRFETITELMEKNDA